MKERPILFSSAMVRAILDGRKVQTRRIVKPRADKDFGRNCVLQPREIAAEVNAGNYRNSVHGEPGDRLWVKETFAPLHGWVENGKRFYDQPFEGGPENYVEYAATNETDWEGPWRPSIFMPRLASRITLEITGVRVERLNAISADDCIAEGLQSSLRENDAVCDLRDQFSALWQSINGPNSWDANPYVWVIEFKRIDAANRE